MVTNWWRGNTRALLKGTEAVKDKLALFTGAEAVQD